MYVRSMCPIFFKRKIAIIASIPKGEPPLKRTDKARTF